MAWKTEEEFNDDFRRRTKELREARDFNQNEVADFLGIELEA